MSGRPSRTSSIPIPTSPVNVRNIENVISIPPSSTSYRRTRLPSTPSLTTSVSPTLARSVPRSASLSVSRSSFRQQFEPRVIRAGPQQPHDAACPPISPTSNRRATFGGYSGPGSASATTRPRAPSTHSTIPLQHTASVEAFARPAYLDNSIFKDSLVTEAPPPLVPARKSDGTSSGPSGITRTYSAPAATPSDSDEESVNSPPPQSRPVPFAPGPSPSLSQCQTYRLPTRWNTEDRHNFLSISADGREIVYNGSSTNGDKDGATARANHSIPPACGIYYYEVEILGKEQKSHVSIGFSGPSVKVSRLPGWETNSWGYHGDDGCSFAAEKNGTPYSHTYGSGDKVGCGIDFSTRRAFYTKNGQFLGHVFENVGKGIDLYPAIGLQHTQECIKVNFGQEPFEFDIENHVQQQKLRVWNKIMATPLHRTPSVAAATGSLPSKEPLTGGESKDMLSKLVLSYLVHHGYAKTVRAFDKQLRTAAKAKASGDADVDMDASSPVKEISTFESLEDDIERRKRIVSAVADGDLDYAIKETQEHHPTVLEMDAGFMLFKLRCRKFVEMVLATAEMKKDMVQMELADKSRRPSTSATLKSTSIVDGDWLQDDMDMDVDVDDDATGYGGSSSRTHHASPMSLRSPSSAPSKHQLEAALTEAINYGQAIADEYKNDSRDEVQTLFKKTFGILAWDQPVEGGEEVAAFVSRDTRIALANELNQAILKSQGRPATPLLETLYRYTSACVTQLGLSGEGSAAFADLNRELLDV